MSPIRVIAIPTSLAEAVRAKRRSPRYNHPAHTEIATGYGPCRHCLRTFHIRTENRILFTYDPFEGFETLPLPGPVFVHEAPCERYPENAGFPEELRSYAFVLNVYARGLKLLTQVYAEPGDAERRILEVLKDSAVDYIEVRDRQAGCFDFRVERANGSEEFTGQELEKCEC